MMDELLLARCLVLAALSVSFGSSFPVFHRIQERLQDPDAAISLITVNLSERCARHVNAYTENLLTAEWALQLLDSTTKIPEGLLIGSTMHLGNFDECIKVRDVQVDGGDHFDGKYCLVTVTPYTAKEATHGIENYRWLHEVALRKNKTPKSGSNVASYLNGLSLMGAICLPSSCTVADFQQLLFDNWPVDYLGLANFMADDAHCQTGDNIPFRAIDWVAIAIFIFFGVLVVLSTSYDLLHTKVDKRNDLLLAFSVYSNGKRLLSTKKTPGALHCLHGIRFLSITWVIIGHRYVLMDSLPGTNNLYFFPELVGNVVYLFIFNADVSVDTFFILSGLLCSYIFLGEMKKGKKFNIFQFYIHRYIRLTPALAVMVLLYTSVINYAADGPFWKERSIVKFSGPCDKYWWTTLLYVGNYVNPFEQCVEQSWYLSVDMHLYWLSPFILFPLWKFPKLGKILLAALLIAGIVISFVMSYCYELMVSFVTTWSLQAMMDFATYYYFPTHTRYMSWLLGIFLGYILFQIKHKKNQLKLSEITVCWIWLLSGACMAVSFWSLYPFIQLDYKFNNLEASFFNALHRPLWSIGVCLMIFACCVGYGGPLNALFSWSKFLPLSRLTYSIYLTHMTIQFITGYPVRAPVYKSDGFALPLCYGDIILAVLLASVMHLVFEAPFLVIEKKLLGGSTKPKAAKATENIEAGSQNEKDVPINGEYKSENITENGGSKLVNDNTEMLPNSQQP